MVEQLHQIDSLENPTAYLPNISRAEISLKSIGEVKTYSPLQLKTQDQFFQLLFLYPPKQKHNKNVKDSTVYAHFVAARIPSSELNSTYYLEIAAIFSKLYQFYAYLDDKRIQASAEQTNQEVSVEREEKAQRIKKIKKQIELLENAIQKNPENLSFWAPLGFSKHLLKLLEKH